ncbi:MAG: ABC transporter ATP-binding protein [Firmicutes bacterium]|nr:ABC transporter ATP-binding protein [Bacillota bacterium]
MTESMIRAIGLTKTFVNGPVETKVLKGIDLEIQRGEFVAIVGPSGSGKSTLIGLLAGLDSVTSGQIFLSGIDISNLDENKLTKIRGELIGYIFQTFNLINTMTAIENVEVPLILNGKTSGSRKRARELLEAVGLEDRLHYLPGQLSGGQQQRVAVARALACDPPIIIADEPTGNLDSAAGEQVMNLLEKTVRETEKTLIVVTHDLEHAKRADRVLKIKDGKIEMEVSDGAVF